MFLLSPSTPLPQITRLLVHLIVSTFLSLSSCNSFLLATLIHSGSSMQRILNLIHLISFLFCLSSAPTLLHHKPVHVNIKWVTGLFQVGPSTRKVPAVLFIIINTNSLHLTRGKKNFTVSGPRLNSELT